MLLHPVRTSGLTRENLDQISLRIHAHAERSLDSSSQIIESARKANAPLWVANGTTTFDSDTKPFGGCAANGFRRFCLRGVESWTQGLIHRNDRFQCALPDRYTGKGQLGLTFVDFLSSLESHFGTFFITGNIMFHKTPLQWKSELLRMQQTACSLSGSPERCS